MAKIHQTSSRIFSRMLRDENIEINPAQGRILFVLWQTDGVPIQELAKQTSLRKSTLTSMLDRLEDAGYIRRVASKTDRRKILIWRTQKDKDLQQQYDHISDKMGKIYYNGFNSQQMQRFDDDLRHILHNLESTEEQLF
ncbi:MarR family transcriptional regulator [bacterium]|nr:MarR family transcriptional regulator [bacterium]